jgi:hypothetical protein
MLHKSSPCALKISSSVVELCFEDDFSINKDSVFITVYESAVGYVR